MISMLNFWPFAVDSELLEAKMTDSMEAAPTPPEALARNVSVPTEKEPFKSEVEVSDNAVPERFPFQAVSAVKLTIWKFDAETDAFILFNGEPEVPVILHSKVALVFTDGGQDIMRASVAADAGKMEIKEKKIDDMIAIQDVLMYFSHFILYIISHKHKFYKKIAKFFGDFVRNYQPPPPPPPPPPPENPPPPPPEKPEELDDVLEAEDAETDLTAVSDTTLNALKSL